MKNTLSQSYSKRYETARKSLLVTTEAISLNLLCFDENRYSCLLAPKATFFAEKVIADLARRGYY